MKPRNLISVIESTFEIFADPVFIFLTGFFSGAIVGSFLNVCISRIPLGQSIVMPSSSCPRCGDPVSWFHNIPIFSWLALRGQASCCDFKLPLRYLSVELFTALLFAFVFFKFGGVGEFDLVCTALVFVSILIVVIGIDFETMTIPDRFSIGGAVAGLALSFSFPSLHGFSADAMLIERMSALFISVTGVLVSSASLYWIGAIAGRLMNKEALGQGDVKLLGFVGAFCGWEGGVFVIFGGAFLGTILLIPVMLFSKFSKVSHANNQQNQLGWGMEIPFGPFLGMAALIYFLGLREFVDGWLKGIISNFLFVFSP